MMPPRSCALAFLFLLLAASLSRSAVTEDTSALIRQGEYRKAIEILVKGRSAESRDPVHDRQLGFAWNQVGGYSETIELLAPIVEGNPSTLRLLGLPLGRALAARGTDAEAEEIFRSLTVGGGPDALSARVALAEVMLRRGQRQAADELLYTLIDAYNQRSTLSSLELTAIARACQLLGRNEPQLFKDALKAYDEATQADSTNIDSLVGVALLFLDKYDSQNARASIAPAFQQNKKHAGTLLALARIHHFDGSPEALNLVEQSLETNPSWVDARVFLATLRLELEEHDEAEKEARAALEVNPRSLEALSVLAAAHFLRGDEEAFGSVQRQVLAQNPTFAGLFVRLAESCVQNRLYEQARDFAQKGVELDPKAWLAWGQLGLNRLRLGEIEEGRKNLEIAFAGDPYNVWNKNTLDLLDTYGDYRLSQHGRFELFVHRDEAELLAPYVGALAEEAYEALAKHYRYEPPTPIRIEVYPSHEDFSVRTIGLAGLGALGVSFGRVVAIDSPSAREVGHFNWGSTLWHELAHTFTLGVTEHRVPRWLTEGLSVFEERRARPGWGDDVRPEFLQALRDGKLLGLAEINNGFVRPSFPIQIALSYYQASLICQLIDQEYGFDKIRQLLEGYRNGKGTATLFPEIFGLSLEDFDRKFFEYLEERFAGALPSFVARRDDQEEQPRAVPSRPSKEELRKRAEEQTDDFRAQLVWGTALFEEKEHDRAMPFLERAKELFPEFVGGGNPYRLLAAIRQEQGDTEGAVSELQQLIAHNEMAYQAHLQLADLLGELERPEQRGKVLDRSLYIYPLAPAVHHDLASLYEHLGNHEGRVRELRAVVALDPPSRAEALFDLATALVDAGERLGARREVLKALELAPGYDEAQRLLLDLVAGDSS